MKKDKSTYTDAGGKIYAPKDARIIDDVSCCLGCAFEVQHHSACCVAADCDKDYREDGRDIIWVKVAA
jgi:hypothetical protein